MNEGNSTLPRQNFRLERLRISGMTLCFCCERNTSESTFCPTKEPQKEKEEEEEREREKFFDENFICIQGTVQSTFSPLSPSLHSHSGIALNEIMLKVDIPPWLSLAREISPLKV